MRALSIPLQVFLLLAFIGLVPVRSSAGREGERPQATVTIHEVWTSEKESNASNANLARNVDVVTDILSSPGDAQKFPETALLTGSMAWPGWDNVSSDPVSVVGDKRVWIGDQRVIFTVGKVLADLDVTALNREQLGKVYTSGIAHRVESVLRVRSDNNNNNDDGENNRDERGRQGGKRRPFFTGKPFFDGVDGIPDPKLKIISCTRVVSDPGNPGKIVLPWRHYDSTDFKP